MKRKKLEVHKGQSGKKWRKKTWTSWIGTQQPKSPKIENIGQNARKIFLTKNLPDSLKVKTTQLC